jgi:flagellar assembly protein FliH
VIPSTSERISARTATAEPRLAHARPRWGTATAATFQTVTELEAADDNEALETKLSDLDRARLDDMARQGYLDGHEHGVRDGYKTGYEQALAEVTARFAPAAEALAAAARQLGAADAVTLTELDQRVTGLALDVAQSVIGHELAATADPGAAALARAIGFVPDRGDLIARLHPDDVAALADTGDLLPGREVTIVADAGVQRGGCLVEVGPCRIDAQLEPAFERVRAALGLGAGA